MHNNLNPLEYAGRLRRVGFLAEVGQLTTTEELSALTVFQTPTSAAFP